jgi:cystathionine beta-lyase
VLHSATKALGGHSDLIAGAAVFSKKHEPSIREALRTFGGCMDPVAGFLLERGVKTLAIRIARQNQTAGFLAQRLAEHSAVKKVNYPGLKTHPGHEVAARQMRGFGTMLSFDLNDFSQAARFIESLKLLKHAASLGGPESLATLPVLSSHYGQPPENWKAAGISDGTVRISVGLEDAQDIWNDIEQALM